MCEPSTLLMKFITELFLMIDLQKNKDLLPLRIFSLKSDLGSKGHFRIRVIEMFLALAALLG